jgi:pilus assembly protein FimV
MARKIIFILIISFASAATSLMALGLGEIVLKSGLNQPLYAEITLLSVRGESNDQLKGKLGSAIDFDRSGIERSYFLTKVKFKTITKANGVRVIQITTKEAVKEPFLNFLVDLEWPNGRLLREYTLLLDPPIFDDAPKTVVTPIAKQTSEPKKQTRKTTPKVSPKPEWEGDVYGPTSGSDTLWGIAAKVRPSGVSMQQAMITIYEINPNAFMRGNINNLKRGADIRVPEADVFNQITQREALRMIAAHNENWKTGKRTKPRVVVDTSPSKNNNSNRDSDKVESESGRLQLGTDSDETGAGGSTASDFLSEEENEVLKQQNESLSEKSIADAEKIAKLERLLELKDEQLTNIQNRNEADLNDTLSTANSAQPNTDIASDSTTDKPEKIKDLTPKPALTKESGSLIDDVMDGTYNLYLGIAGVIIFLLLVVSIFRRKKQEVGYYDAVEATRTPLKSKATPTISESADELPETADDVLAGSDISDIEQDIEQEEVGTDDTSDPLGEADIYLAYGKFDQAESILLSAIGENPERLELRTKLLECYSEMKEQDKFEEHVSSINNEIDSDTELKSFIEELYLSTWPEGSLFAAQYVEQDRIAETTDIEDDDFSFEDDSDEAVINEDQVIDEPSSLEELPSTEDVFGDAVSVENEDASDIGEELIIDIEEQEPEQQDGSENMEQTEENEDVNTQLDLARAYVEMGDIEGTREIIAEILEIGSQKQCEEAQGILDSLDN